MGSIIGYILLFIMLAFTLFNIYATATKKKRDQANEIKYNALFAPIDNEILKLGKDWKGSPTMRLITEKEEGIVCVRDDGRKRAVIAWDGDLRTFRFNEFGGAELVDDESGIKILVSGLKTIASMTMTSLLTTPMLPLTSSFTCRLALRR